MSYIQELLDQYHPDKYDDLLIDIIKQMKADLAEMLDDRSEVNRLIQQYHNDSVGLLIDIIKQMKARKEEIE